MRATVFHRPGLVTVEDRPTPQVGPSELRLSVAATSLCASDVRVYRGEKHATPGVIPGHEIAGVVDAIGDEITTVEEGDRVVLCPILSCGFCRYCIVGRRNRCTSRRTLGYDVDGGFAEHLLVPEEIVNTGHVLIVPDDLALDIAAITEPAACVLASLELCRVQAGTSMAIVGAGPMGLLHLLLGRALGASPIIVSEPEGLRRAVATNWGADLVLDPGRADVRGNVLDATNGYGADAVIVSVGVADLVPDAIQLARPQGIVNLFAGFPRDGEPIPFDPNFVHYGEVVLTGSQNANTDQYRRALALLRIVPHIGELVTNRYDIERAPEAYRARLEMDGLKSLVHFPGIDSIRA